MKWLACILLSSITMAAVRQNPVELPEGEGKQILQTTCASCHELDVFVKNEGLKEDGWKMVLDRMMQYGANVSGSDSTVLVQYLKDNFGEGRKVLDTACTACHGLNEVKKFQGFYKREDWQDVVVTMVKYGADVKEAQIPVLVEYLTRTYSPKKEK